MIQSKHINAIVTVAFIFSLVAALLIVGYANSQVVEVGRVQPYESALFGGDIIRLEIIADQDDWDNMIANAMQEEYIMVDVIVNGTKFQSVGIRPKGNSSLSQVASTDSPQRYSFRLKFDEYIEGQTCFGLDTFVVNNMIGDNSYMKEYLSYELMTYIGVDAPLYDFANISVNGEKWGLYLAVEAYNDSYMTRAFGDASGNLYNVKSMDMGNRGDGPNMGGFPQMPGNGQMPEIPSDGQFPGMFGNGQMPEMPDGGQFPGMPGMGQMPGGQQGGQNQGIPDNGQIPEMPGNSQMPDKSMDGQLTMPGNGQMSTIPGNGQSSTKGGFGGMFGGRGGGDLQYTDDNISSYSSIFDNAIGKVTEESKRNVIEALKNLSEGTNLETYFDVDQILRYMAAHTIVVNLDSYSSNMAQNYYIYEKDGKLTILPWDYNYAFGAFQAGDASSVVNFPIDTPVSGVSLQDRPLFAQLLANETYKAKYHEYLHELMTGYFTEGKWAEKIDQLDHLISDYVKNDPSKFCTFEEYEKAVDALKTLGELRSESILGQLNGTVPSTTEGQKQNPEALVSAEALNMSDLGGSGMGGGRGKWSTQRTESSEQAQQAGGFGRRGQMFDRGMGSNRGDTVSDNARRDFSALILLTGSVVLLIGTTIFAAKYRRRY